MKTTYEISFEKNNVCQARLCEAPNAEIARAYFESIEPTATVYGVSKAYTFRPGQPKEIVPDGWEPDQSSNAESTNETKPAKVYDLKSIMSRAWAIRKAAAVKIGCKVSEVVFSLCLKQAWAEAEGVNAEANANKVINEWAELGESGQSKMMSACIRKAAKNEIGYSTEDHYLQFSEVPAFSCFREHDFDEFISETCIRVLKNWYDVDEYGIPARLNIGKLARHNEKRAEQGKRPMSLVSIVYNAARASIAAVYYQDAKHGAAYDFEISDGEGNTASYLETMVGSGRDDTERSAVIRATLDSYMAGLDKIGKQIIAMVVQGKTEREIGKSVGISNVAVHKRIVKMRAALEDLRAA